MPLGAAMKISGPDAQSAAGIEPALLSPSGMAVRVHVQVVFPSFGDAAGAADAVGQGEQAESGTMLPAEPAVAGAGTGSGASLPQAAARRMVPATAPFPARARDFVTFPSLT